VPNISNFLDGAVDGSSNWMPVIFRMKSRKTPPKTQEFMYLGGKETVRMDAVSRRAFEKCSEYIDL
jgi:hypothetical protein